MCLNDRTALSRRPMHRKGDGMIEVRIHGRGGQGNVVAAYSLAGAAIGEGWHAQAFPAFGAERRGAPVAAFVRMAEQPFRRRDQVAQPDFLIIQDEALLHVPGILSGLKPGGGVLVNATREPAELGLPGPVFTVSATQLAQEYLGRPVPNTALLAVFLTLTELLPVQALITALGARFKGKVLDANTRLIEAAAAQVPAGQWKEAMHAASA
ncbi:MAG: 2-oxoacid:acceptor oxidoreductase family protein [Gammaproteobacteria bacterium]|jgi:pyruvate ferredoxin oxidoreductase gamma subunit